MPMTICRFMGCRGGGQDHSSNQIDFKFSHPGVRDSIPFAEMGISSADQDGGFSSPISGAFLGVTIPANLVTSGIQFRSTITP